METLQTMGNNTYTNPRHQLLKRLRRKLLLLNKDELTGFIFTVCKNTYVNLSHSSSVDYAVTSLLSYGERQCLDLEILEVFVDEELEYRNLKL